MMSKLRSTTRWIYSPLVDLLFIISPPFIVTALVFIFKDYFQHHEEVPVWCWAVLVIGIDVSHVYSTLYRTYFDREEFSKRKNLYTFVPIVCFVGGVVLYSIGPLIFWRMLAYLAVWHFIRQQYGFFIIYRRGESNASLAQLIDKNAIYLSTLYPIIYWHTHPRAFNWFIDGDFFSFHATWIETMAWCLYALSLGLYFGKAIIEWFQSRTVNVGKHLILFGSALSWYVGIVLFNGDLVFTLTNVISHGIPYMALIWIFQRKRFLVNAPKKQWSPNFFSLKKIPLYVISLLMLAYAEEWLWDGLIWRERPTVFGVNLYSIHLPPLLLVMLIPLLALPQFTHYILDAFIWRVNRSQNEIGVKEGSHEWYSV